MCTLNEVCDGLAEAVLELPGVMAAAGYLTSTAAFVLLAAACCVLSLPPGSSAEGIATS